MKQKFSSGGLAVWSTRHPIGVSMIAIAIIVLGLFSLGRLGVDLLPNLIYPDIRVRILDSGVPATIMEDKVTRQLEEQLAITEGAVRVQSRTSEGRSAVDLSFDYGTDIDQALRDASTRLDRAKRFLPDSIEPPVIYKRDPSQIPVLEIVVASDSMDAVSLTTWVDYVFTKWFLTLPGVAAVEVGGGLEREIQVLADPVKLAGRDMDLDTVANAIRNNNQDYAAGRLESGNQQISSRTIGRLDSIEALNNIALSTTNEGSQPILLREIADTLDTHADERLRIRLNQDSGIKISIQKQPGANTVEVVDEVRHRLDWLRKQSLIPKGVSIETVSDQAVFVRQALHNASQAALSGGILAMLVVYLFLGSLVRTLIIGSAIPIAILVTFLLMGFGDLTLNVMTLGGLALGIGLLVDSTIVMLENITRHQHVDSNLEQAPVEAAGEVNSAIVASTMTNLAAILPFLFITGLTGLLFRELIFTISAAILASMLVALTLVPALATRIGLMPTNTFRTHIDNTMQRLQNRYSDNIRKALNAPWIVIGVFIALLAWSVPTLLSLDETFLPSMDDGQIRVSITADPGINLERMDDIVRDIETLYQSRDDVESVFAQVGGFVFGRSSYESSNRSSLSVQLTPRSRRNLSSDAWVSVMQKEVAQLGLVGVSVRMRVRGLRGVSLSHGDDDISIRVQGQSLDTLEDIGDRFVSALESVQGVRNLEHSLEDKKQELAVVINHERAARFGVTGKDIGSAVRNALEGSIVSDYIDGDRSIDVRLRLAPASLSAPQHLDEIILRSSSGQIVHLADVATVELVASPATIRRDLQQRIVEVSASLDGTTPLGEVLESILGRLEQVPIEDGYGFYEGGAGDTLQASRELGMALIGLAIFLVFVVMAVQYESLRNPLVIITSVPFAVIGVTLGLSLLGLPVSMPVRLGLIMLAGIVVNNAIVLVECIEIQRRQDMQVTDAIVAAARIRLRPILMTTLTTVAGLTPLALALGEGAEMLQPLALTIVFGLSFSLLVSLLLAPCVYCLMHRE
ncbi:MAG TPA: efflux RND transporter permease subunit [Chromatiaceae bacterium]|nr:efflux RND transporter permease subunit [Chromatiaceae bacterium]HIB84037.1 efflux RND transporter permease subunit [Chromatiaceae bacterium]